MNIETWEQYKEYLPGLHKDCPDEFIYLAQILKENVFELIEKKKERQYHIVYMMNDAIESFLVFENAVMIGAYETENEDSLQGTLDHVGDDYILSVRQGNSNSFTIRFSRLTLENTLYQYHNIGHFWVKGDEYLRQINYRLGILQDKYQFLNKKVCTQDEIDLLSFYEFAPLRNYICVSWEKEEPFITSMRGIQAFLQIAQEANDSSMEKWIHRYKKRPSKWNEWVLTKMLKTVRHKRVVDLLIDKIAHASQAYIERSFGEAEDCFITHCRNSIREKICNHNTHTVLEEQPFSIGEEFTYTFHLLNWKETWIFRNVKIHSIVLKGTNLPVLENEFHQRLDEYFTTVLCTH
ncbi:DUF3878 family protein [Anaerosporobacter sp.]|uniref:DUF3878 family protein n=1 Tax=Anaerosporobacter sp. TaxID=1872529 RepID=UPI00286F0B27|nr:DUF3878 family protein [Anaerosporobacter sp.]